MGQYLDRAREVIREHYSDVASYSVTAGGDPDYPFVVCPVGRDGIDMGVIACFVGHSDVLMFTELKRCGHFQRKSTGGTMDKEIESYEVHEVDDPGFPYGVRCIYADGYIGYDVARFAYAHDAEAFVFCKNIALAEPELLMEAEDE